MGWYRTGTVAVTSGSTAVIGTGTLWSLNAKPGDAFTIDGTKIYEIASLDATTPNTKLYLTNTYSGATVASGQTYAIMNLSTVSISTATLANQVSALLNSWQGREDEFRVWQAGSATGGYNISGAPASGSTAGYYPMTDPLGVTSYVACPAKVEALTNTTGIGITINAATAKSTPVDADMLALMDSAAANVIKKLSWLNVKATMKAYMDTLYPPKIDPTLTGTVTIPVPAATMPASGTNVAAPTIWVKDTLRSQLEGMTGGLCTILYDVAGNPNYMRILPVFRCEDISANLGTGIHPAFMVNGVAKSQIFLPMYPAANVGGLGCSIPGVAPYTSINFDNAKAACVNKGAGWHMMSNWEWAALTFWCIKNGDPLLRGNTYWGQSHAKPSEGCKRIDSAVAGTASGTGSMINGTDPITWRHDGSPAGISGLVGNIWEWQDGMKLVDGVIKMPTDNNYTLAEASWPDTLVRIDNVGGIQISDTITSRSVGIGWTAFKDVPVKGGYTPPIALKQALLCPYDTAVNMGNVSGSVYANNSISFEALPLRSGGWSSASYCGLAALYLSYSRAVASGAIGFRPAFIG